ncbi:acyltransferase [Kineococcus gynurae]|uniref:Acyltransferase n=1 Tax=Kineococcus gynurae TaxID=452979 RepID=A0ABV5LWV8_9ACTN
MAGAVPDRVRRLLDPRSWLHALRMVDFYAANHVAQVRALRAGPGLRMSPSASLRNGERITLGTEVHVGERCCLWAGDSSGRITLGDNVLLAPEVFITASNYGTRRGEPIMYQAKREAEVVVGRDVWLGARVLVMPGVRIGDEVVVAAGAVVTKDLPSGCIAGGVPARVIGWREPAADGAPSAVDPAATADGGVTR